MADSTDPQVVANPRQQADEKLFTARMAEMLIVGNVRPEGSAAVDANAE